MNIIFLDTLKRTSIVFFWVVCIVFFLYLPTIVHWFKEPRSLTVFTWPIIFDAHILEQFEKETGIRVYLSYYETNEELYSKLKQGGGKGYDIVIPTDYAVAMLIQDGLLRKLDKSKLNFIKRLDPIVLNHYYDPNNEYTYPYFWGVYGLGINTNYFDGEVPEATWGLLFEKELIPGRIAMTNAPREAIMLAAQYLYGTIESLTDPAKVEKVKELLIKQKEWVQLYNEARTEDLLLSNSCPIVAALSPDVWKTKKEENTDHITFIRPEKSFVFIDSFAITKASTKEDLAYEFLNFVYRPEIVKHHMDLYGSCSPVRDISSQAPAAYCPSRSAFANLDFFRDILPLDVLDTIWVDLMAY